jgi:opacity protein-like surface antigen
MKKIFTTSTAILLGMSFASISFAGHPDMPAPPQANHLGWYIGVGAAATAVSGEASSLTNSTSTNDNEMGITPLIQLGYWQDWANNWLWGAKFSYKYLGTIEDLIEPTTSNTLEIDHEVLALFTIGKSFGQQGFAYLGAGPVFMPATSTNSLVGVTPGANSQSKNLWGGAVQGGLTYFLTPSIFLDFTYTYAQTMSKQIDTSNGTTIDSANVSAATQEFAMSVNTFF